MPTRTPEAMMKLPIEDLLGNSCVIQTNDMSTPSELCGLQKCLNSTDVVYFEYSGTVLKLSKLTVQTLDTFLSPLRGYRDLVRCSYWAHWKARSGLPTY